MTGERVGPPQPGLCGTCVHAKRIVTTRGSRFLLCRLSRSDPAFPRYPRLPVLACRGYRRRPEDPPPAA